MARKQAPVITPDLEAEIYSAIEELKRLSGRLDQFTACGVDCDAFRAMSAEISDTLQRIVEHVIKGKPVPTS